MKGLRSCCGRHTECCQSLWRHLGNQQRISRDTDTALPKRKRSPATEVNIGSIKWMRRTWSQYFSESLNELPMYMSGAKRLNLISTSVAGGRRHPCGWRSGRPGLTSRQRWRMLIWTRVSISASDWMAGCAAAGRGRHPGSDSSPSWRPWKVRACACTCLQPQRRPEIDFNLKFTALFALEGLQWKQGVLLVFASIADPQGQAIWEPTGLIACSVA